VCSGTNLSSLNAGNETLVLPNILHKYKDEKCNERCVQASTDNGSSAIKE